MTVLIKEMRMPERCEDCPFFVVFHVKRMGVCLAHNPQSGIDEKRKTPKPDWCPLEEKEGKRLYTEAEVRKIINGTVADVEFGIHDPYDILPEDFV